MTASNSIVNSPVLCEMTQAYHERFARQNETTRHVLMTEPDRARRLTAYQDWSGFDARIFNLLKALFAERHQTQSGVDHFNPPPPSPTEGVIPFERKFGTVEMCKWKQKFSASYRRRRLEILGTTSFRPEDYWYLSPEERQGSPYFIRLCNSFENTRKLARNLFTIFGFGKIFTRIGWETEVLSTSARIWFDENGDVAPIVRIAPSPAHGEIGTLEYFSIMVHEIGHAVQACLVEAPHKDGFAPPVPFIETVAMFFQSLVKTPEFLNQVTKLDNERLAVARKRQGLETAESFLRFSLLLEFEIALYRLYAENSFTPQAVSSVWNQLFQDYFGIENSNCEDHLWMNYLGHIVHEPFCERSYVLGSQLSDTMLRVLLDRHSEDLFSPEAVRIVRDFVVRASRRGVRGRAEDFVGIGA